MKKDITELLDIMATLRDPRGGCPWDLQQDFASIAPYTIEEAYEVADAIEQGDLPALKTELGDLLFQVVFHARMAEERGAFDFADVVGAVCDKMIRRHPHVFDPGHEPLSAEEQSRRWDAMKTRHKDSVLDDIPHNMPELLRATKLTRAAAVLGFDWPDVWPVFDKLDEEKVELQHAIRAGDAQAIKDELGDLLFVCSNLARHLDIDAGAALRHANAKFERRFRAVEKRARARDPAAERHPLEALEADWQAVKKDSE